MPHSADQPNAENPAHAGTAGCLRLIGAHETFHLSNEEQG